MAPAGDDMSLRAAERALQAAQLASDVATLDDLIDDAALFAGPDGAVASKQDDLTAHRTGIQRLSRVDELELQVRMVGPTGVTCLLADLAGTMADQPFAARVRYTRTWFYDVPSGGWRVLAAQATVVST